MTKNGTGAYYSHFDSEELTASLDFSGKCPLYPGDTQCYRNDSTVFLYVAHSYLYAYCEIMESIRRAFEAKQVKMVQHLIIPVYYLFRHYMELELKSFYMALSKDRADNIHNLLQLYAPVQTLTYECDGAEKSGSEEDFQKNKKEALIRLETIKKLIQQYQQIEPYEEFYRYLYDKKINLTVSEVSFDYVKQDAFFSKITKVFSELEECYSIMLGFNYLLG